MIEEHGHAKHACGNASVDMHLATAAATARVMATMRSNHPQSMVSASTQVHDRILTPRTRLSYILSTHCSRNQNTNRSRSCANWRLATA